MAAEQVPKEVSAGFDQDEFSQEQEGADTTITEGLPTSSPDKSAPVSSEQASFSNASKALGALPQKASGSPSEKASNPSPYAKLAESTTSIAAPPTKTAQPPASRFVESAAITDAEPAAKLKEHKEAKPEALNDGEQEGDSWRLAAHHTASSSSSSSTGMSSAGEGSTAASGDCGGAEQQEAADATEVLPLQPTDPQDTVAVKELSLKPAKEGQTAINRLQTVQEIAAGSGCAEQQNAVETAASFPVQPIQQQDTTAVKDTPVEPTKEEQKAAANDYFTKTEPQLAAGNHPEQPTKPQGEAAASKHPKEFCTAADQAGAGTLPRQLTQEIAAAGDELSVQTTQKLPVPAHTSSSPSRYQEQQRRPHPRVLNRGSHSEGVWAPPSDIALPPCSFRNTRSILADPSALESGKSCEGSRPSLAPGASLRGPLQRPNQGRGRGMIQHHYNHWPPHGQSFDSWQPTHFPSPALSPPQSPSSVLSWGSFGTSLGSHFSSDFISQHRFERPSHRAINNSRRSEGVGTPLSHTALQSHSFSTARSTCADPIALDIGETCQGIRHSSAHGPSLRRPLQRPTEGRGMTRQLFKQMPPQEQSATSQQQSRPPSRALSSPQSPASVLTWGSFGTSLSTGLVSDDGTEYCAARGPSMGQVTTSPLASGPTAHRALKLHSVPSFCQGTRCLHCAVSPYLIIILSLGLQIACLAV